MRGGGSRFHSVCVSKKALRAGFREERWNVCRWVVMIEIQRGRLIKEQQPVTRGRKEENRTSIRTQTNFIPPTHVMFGRVLE